MAFAALVLIPHCLTENMKSGTAKCQQGCYSVDSKINQKNRIHNMPFYAVFRVRFSITCRDDLHA